MNNWHIKIEDCTEVQKERLKQVYGTGILRYDYYGRDKNSIAAYNFDVGELITPDEAFERLGLGEDTKALAKCENSIVKTKKQLTRRTAKLREAEQIIKELEQQLAAKPLSIDWTLVDSNFTHLVQDKKTGGSRLLCAGYYSDHKDCYHLIATRPKPKYTPEQIEAVKDFDAWVSRRHKLSGEFNWWLKEVSDD